LTDLERALSIFKEFYPALRVAMDREAASWKEYERVGIGKITKEMVKERQEATKALDREWLNFTVKVGWARCGDF
jgi:hypothetical protein